jgi:scyllo-inositol 2-dehydrogenase (NADP+)
MSAIGVGIVGYGMAAKTFHIPLIGAEGRLVLRCIATNRPEVVHAEIPEMQTCTTVDELVARDDIHLVVVAGKNQDHFRQSKIALTAGKNVVVEKPMTITVDEADELIAIAAAQGVMFTVFHNRRWDNGTLELEKLLANGTLGELALCSLYFDRLVPHPRERWREDAIAGSGMLYDLGSHLFFTALLLFGRPDSLVADVGMQRTGARADDYFNVQLTYGKLRVQLRSSMLVPANNLVLEAHGSLGSFRKFDFDPQENMLKSGLIPNTSHWDFFEPADYALLWTVNDDSSISEERIDIAPGTYASFYAGVATAIADGVPAPIRASTARDCIWLIEKSFESARSGMRMTF